MVARDAFTGYAPKYRRVAYLSREKVVNIFLDRWIGVREIAIEKTYNILISYNNIFNSHTFRPLTNDHGDGKKLSGRSE